MKVISLKELQWFSFTSSLDSKKRLTLWQSIYLILMKIEGFHESAMQFADEMDKLERKVTDELLDEESGANLFSSEQIKSIDEGNSFLEDLTIPMDTAFKQLELFDAIRGNFVDTKGLPFTLVYELLISEIRRYRSGDLVSLKIYEKKLEDGELYFFGKTKLKECKSIENLNQLGLSNSVSGFSRDQRYDRRKRQEIITGMVLHLLSSQPILDRFEKPIKFHKGEDVSNVNFSGIYKYFEKNYLNGNEEEFPEERTVTDYLKMSYQGLSDKIKSKNK